MANETEYYAIQGIPVKEGQPLPLRQECNVWAKDSETSIQVSLFIRALQKFYDIPYDQKLSYFQVAGRSTAVARAGRAGRAGSLRLTCNRDTRLSWKLDLGWCSGSLTQIRSRPLPLLYPRPAHFPNLASPIYAPF
jgi:hypothetical protein